MIITCINCAKEFNVESSVIPEKGRLLQCNSCNHKWFFKKEVINKTIAPIKINISNLKPEVFVERIDSPKIDSSETIELLEKLNKDDSALEKDIKEVKNLKLETAENKKNYNILSLTIVFITSVIALIIVLDTFQGPISKIFPNIELLLYNLYETINDIVLFFQDLI
jgi:predicted Zn finger-like uncharacterized protein